jgi:DinB superfamily
MNANELLADLVQTLAASLREELGELSPEALAWQPDPEGNGIGITVWHVSRWLDLLAVQILQARPAPEEQWHTRGWAARTGYDPRGIGYRGLGALTGYTWAEVEAVPPLPAADLLAYLDQAATALRDHLLALPTAALWQPAPGGNGTRTVYDYVKGPLLGAYGHIGEIAALKALRARRSE